MWKKCKVVRLTTEDVTNVAFVNWGTHNVPHWNFSYNPKGFTADEIYYHLYILSDDEIKEGDWYLGFDNYPNDKWTLYNCVTKPNGNPHRKIIASTDPFLNFPRPSNEFLKAYCREGGIDEVMVEFFNEDEDWDDTTGAIRIPSSLKIALDNTVTIRKVKDSWSREEIENFILQKLDIFYMNVESKNHRLPLEEEIKDFLRENL